MLTWDETKQAVDAAQSTSATDFERHLASYVVQGVIQKLQDDYIEIAMQRIRESGGTMDMETLLDIVAHECAIFMTGIQVGWYLAESAFRHE